MGCESGVKGLESPPVADGFEQTSLFRANFEQHPVKLTPVTSSFSSIVNTGSEVPNEPKDDGILGGLYFLIGGLYFLGPDFECCRSMVYNDKDTF